MLCRSGSDFYMCRQKRPLIFATVGALTKLLICIFFVRENTKEVEHVIKNK